MDLTRAVGYRGLGLNTIRFDAATRDMVGIEITSVEYGNVLGHGYDEKRALADGFDKSDVFMGKRLISLAGNVYGRTRAEAFDLYMQLVDKLTPTDAYEAYPSTRGYSSMDFYIPVPVSATWPTGLIHLIASVRPLASPGARFDSDRHGGQDNQALAIPWNAQLDARIPDLVNFDSTTVSLNIVGKVQSGTLHNRGNRPASLWVRLLVPPNFNGTTENGAVIIRVGANRFRIVVPRSGQSQEISYDTGEKILTINGRVRMDCLNLLNGVIHPKVLPGRQSYGFDRNTSTLALKTGSVLRFRDTFA